MIINYKKETENIETISRYNGGWLKTVKGLDKSKNNGYSIIGEFVKAGDYENNYDEGLYLDCSKEGSRKNQKWNYHLLRFSKENGIEVLKTLPDAGRNWAVSFWEIIEQELKNNNMDKSQAILNSIYGETTDEETLLKIVLGLLEKINKTNDCLEISKKMLCKVDRRAKNLFDEVDLEDTVKLVTPKEILQKLKYEENPSYDEDRSVKCQVIAKAYLTFNEVDDESKYNYVRDDSSSLTNVLVYNLEHRRNRYDYVCTCFGEYFVKIDDGEVVVVDFRY